MKKITAKKGFSLTEVIMSLVIMTVVALFLISAVPNEFSVSANTQDVAKASDLAQKYLEQIKNDLKTLPTFGNVEEGTTPPIDITDTFTANGYFDVTTEVVFVGRTGGESYLKEIQVLYTKAGESDPIIDIATIIAQPEG